MHFRSGYIKAVAAILVVALGWTIGQPIASTAQVAQPNCTATVSAPNPGDITAFNVTTAPGLITIDPNDAGTGLQSLTVSVGPVNAVVNIPAFQPGTLAPVTVTYTVTNPNQAASFTLRIADAIPHVVLVAVNCEAPQCNSNVCVLTQGFWKNKPEAWPVTTLQLGSVSYTQAQLLLVLGQPTQGNGLVSLSKQLIAAKLNIAGGACVPAGVAAAITQADTLIGSKVVPPIGNGSLSPSSTSSLTTILDNYNNGIAPGGPSHCNN